MFPARLDISVTSGSVSVRKQLKQKKKKGGGLTSHPSTSAGRGPLFDFTTDALVYFTRSKHVGNAQLARMVVCSGAVDVNIGWFLAFPVAMLYHWQVERRVFRRLLCASSRHGGPREHAIDEIPFFSFSEVAVVGSKVYWFTVNPGINVSVNNVGIIHVRDVRFIGRVQR